MTDTPEVPEAPATSGATDILTLSQVTRAEFEQWVGQDFHVALVEDTELPLRLEEVRNTVSKFRPDSYILAFSGPTDRYFQHGTPIIRMPDDRRISFHLINNGPMNGAMRYWASFN